MFHRSERLLLRPIWPEDWQGIFGGIADEGIVRNLARAPWPYAEEDARVFASRKLACDEPRFLITAAADASVVGCIGLDINDEEYEHAVELGYWIARPFWGQGFATEAGQAVLQIARTLGHNHVVASHFVDNPASGRVLEKLGFEPTGRVVDRHSCGRGESAPAAEFARNLASESVLELRAA